MLNRWPLVECRYKTWELLEISLVTVPAQSAATINLIRSIDRSYQPPSTTVKLPRKSPIRTRTNTMVDVDLRRAESVVTNWARQISALEQDYNLDFSRATLPTSTSPTSACAWLGGRAEAEKEVKRLREGRYHLNSSRGSLQNDVHRAACRRSREAGHRPESRLGSAGSILGGGNKSVRQGRRGEIEILWNSRTRHHL